MSSADALPPDQPDVGAALAAPARLDALRRTDLLDTPPDVAFDRYTRLISRIVGVPVALLSLVDDERQFFKSVLGLPEPWSTRRQTGLSHSFCQHVVAADEPFVVTDAHTDQRVSGNEAVEDLRVVAYLGAPVRGAGGQPIGSLCAIDHEPRQWSDEDVALLVELAEVTSELIAMRTAAAQRRAAVVEFSHRLRTGLTALRLQAEEVVADAGPEAVGSAAALVRGLEAQSAVLDEALAQLGAGADGHEREVDAVAVAQEAVRRAGARRRTVVLTEPPADGPLVLRAGAAEVGRLLDDVVDVLDGEVRLSVLAGASAVRFRLQDAAQGLSDDVVQALVGRHDGAADASGSLAERAARTLGARLVLVGNRPATVDLLVPRGGSPSPSAPPGS